MFILDIVHWCAQLTEAYWNWVTGSIWVSTGLVFSLLTLVAAGATGFWFDRDCKKDNPISMVTFLIGGAASWVWPFIPIIVGWVLLFTSPILVGVGGAYLVYRGLENRRNKKALPVAKVVSETKTKGGKK